MKILMVNKFLYLKGGSETYIFKLGNYLEAQGHKVEYFGMEDEKNIMRNRVNSYTTNMNFHTSKLNKLLYPIKIIYSVEARKKIRILLNDFKPDVVHLNNFNFQITPSIIYEIKKYEKEKNKKIKIIFTAHDYQLICPNHMMNNPINGENCEKCSDGNFINCIKGRCLHKSFMKSSIASFEGYLYNMLQTYKYIDLVICPSSFMEKKIGKNKFLKDKTIVLHNFIERRDKVINKKNEKENYILYFGRFSKEKGIDTLISVCKKLPCIKFKFAGSGPLEERINKISNIENVGFKKGKELEELITNAKFSICPSEWYENCPFSVIESQMHGTPVLGADIGGIPELIQEFKTGELFESGNQQVLKRKIEEMWSDSERINKYKVNCNESEFKEIDEYYSKLIEIYGD